MVISYLSKNTSKLAMNTAVQAFGNIPRVRVMCKVVDVNPEKITESARNIDSSVFNRFRNITQSVEDQFY